MPNSYAELIVRLEKQLKSIAEVSEHDNSGEYEASRIANGLCDILASANKIEKSINKIAKGMEAKETVDALMEVGEELRHIKYHLNDMAFFRSFVE